ncbi:PadR family transcriptional regulator [Humibacter ginsenosidimutans]|uniref:PadR family transcriptional regulator n=1 Tax=Humibacter ginsenosidimutans TaxID=2599293 RepID=A0A5B8M4I7_9MICO|nr:PadR family transcriptional regulator [Humibacter ginsenosidimutans]QDZ15226.1 PadR family transcriptional regulator [Humibacter ginsenosidimutans]
MSIRQSLLAILDQGPCYGYQLRAEFDRRTGGTWPLNVGQIYQTLDRLERDGLVAKGESDHEGRAYYEITEAGSAAVTSWLASPVDRHTATRDEFAIKLAVAATLPGVDVARVLQVQRTSTMALLRDLTRTKESIGEPTTREDLAHLLVIDGQIFQLDGELRWLDHTEGRLARAVADGLGDPIPLDTDVPKRGRPVRQTSVSAAEH